MAAIRCEVFIGISQCSYRGQLYLFLANSSDIFVSISLKLDPKNLCSDFETSIESVMEHKA